MSEENEEVDFEIESASFIEQLSKNDLTIYWCLPELHKVTQQVVRLPDETVKMKIRDLGLTWKTGRFSPDEDKRIAKNWKKLCKNFDLPDDPKAFSSWRNTTQNRELSKVRRYAILWLSRKLSDRMPCQVFQRFNHSFGSKTKGRFTEHEIEIIEEFLLKDNSYTQQYLGSILNRDERSMWRRLTLMKNKKLMTNEVPKKLRWDLEMHERLYKSIMSAVNEDNQNITLEHLRHRPITWNEWIKIGKKMGIPPLSAKTQWNQKLYVQFFATEKIYSRPIILKLIKKFKKKGFKHWTDVNWKRVSRKFPGYTSIFLWKIYYFFARKKCRNLIKTFHETVDFLHEKYVINDHYIKNFMLKRVVINSDQKMVFHPEDVTS